MTPTEPTGASQPTSAPDPKATSSSTGKASESHRTPPLPQLVTELKDLVVTYVKEQTLVPLKSLGRYIGFGVAGSLLLGIGVVFLAMSCLRALQTQTDGTFDGNWSWVPYLITFVALLVGAAVVWLARTARKVEKEYG
jgi:hypothetical protein